MQRIAAGHERGCDDRRDAGIGARDGSRTDADCLVGQPDRKRVAVGIAVGDHGRDVEVPAGAQNAEGNFAPIGNQNLTHRRSRQDAMNRPPSTVRT